MQRLRAIIIKEIWALIRDPKARIMLIAPPLMQLLIFAFAVTLEVKNIDIAILDQSSGAHSSEFISQLAGSPNVRHISRLSSPRELREKIDLQKTLVALVIEPDFDRKLDRGEPATIGVVLDGRRSNAAQIVNSYIQTIALRVGAQLRADPSVTPAEPSVVRNWFNPNLDYFWFNMPSLIVVIVSVSSLAVTAQTVARERELGTFDQLMVSPLRVHEILAGKMLPPLLLGFLNGTLFLVLAQIVFGVPFTGSLTLFYLALVVFMMALIGIGMFVSALSMTQQQAFLGSFLILVPLVLLSGFASPIENMPEWLQLITYLNPARYFVEMSLGLFLKAMPAAMVFERLWPLALIAAGTLSASAWLFRARME